MLAPGIYWARYRVQSWGLPPLDPIEATAMLDRNVPGHPAITFLDRASAQNDIVYGLGREYLAWYYSRGTWIGDHSGPAEFQQMLEAGSTAELKRRLDALGAKWLVVSKKMIVPALASPDVPKYFESVYDDESSIVYKLRD